MSGAFFVYRMSLRTSGALRSESKIIMTAGGSHTTMQRTLVWPLPGIPSGHNPHPLPSLGGRWHGAAVTDEGKGSPWSAAGVRATRRPPLC